MSDGYQPTWSSLATHPTPRWFLEAKCGILHALGFLLGRGVRRQRHLVSQAHV